jgi:hypothetical protein
MLVCIDHCVPVLAALVSAPEQGLGDLGVCLGHAEVGVEERCVDYASAVGQESSVGIATCYRLDGLGIESHWRARFDAPIQAGPGTHPTSYTLGTGSLAGGHSGWGVVLTTHHLALRLKKE